MFHPAPGTFKDADLLPLPAGEPRIFEVLTLEGQGSTALRVPGLKRLFAIRFGYADFPLEQHLSFPSGTSTEAFAQKIPVVWPLISIEADTDGCPVLLRSLHSNDGIWQEKMPITVFGEWEAAPKATGKAA